MPVDAPDRIAATPRLAAVSSSRCGTCKSPERVPAEILLVQGLGYTEVVRRLGNGSRLSPKNLREHCIRGHRAVESEVVRRLIQTTSGGREAVLEMGVGRAVRQLVEAQATVEAVDALLAAGALLPTLHQGIRAARMLAHYDEAVRADKLHTRRLEAADSAFVAILGIAREHMAPRAWSAFLEAVQSQDDLRPYCAPPLAA